MKLNYSNFDRELNKNKLFYNKSKIAVAVSGGADSMTLAHLLSRWAIKKNYKLIALIIDHKLRKESKEEANDVSKYLSKLKIKNKIIEIKNIDIFSNIQAKARKHRYEKLYNYCKKNKIFHLFLGHHLDDNIETFILRKVAGSNIEGLNSIKTISLYNDILVLRPLLRFSKKNILEYAERNNLKWVEDPSNTNNFFSRIKIRNTMKNNNKLRLNAIADFKKINSIYNDYLEMINTNLVFSIKKISSKYVELDSYYFASLNVNLSLKILDILIKHVHNGKIYLKYAKIENIYNNLINAKPQFRSQNTIFKCFFEKIVIYKLN